MHHDCKKNMYELDKIKNSITLFPKTNLIRQSIATATGEITIKTEEAETAAATVTGTGGAGKSSFVDEIVRRLLQDFQNISIGIVCVDPSKKKTGGALLGFCCNII